MFDYILNKLFGNEPQTALYPDLTLPPRVVPLLEHIDHFVSVHAPAESGDSMQLHIAQIPLNLQHYSVDRLRTILEQQMQQEYDGLYIPRSVAFFTEADGTWVFVYSTRTNTRPSDTVSVKMFIDLLTRTNNAR